MEYNDLIDSGNDLIRIDDQTGEIVAAPEALQIDFFQELKSQDETYFNNALIYTYHVYKFNHPFSRMFFAERKKKVCNTYLHGTKPEDFSNNETVRKIIKLFVEVEYTPSQRLYMSVMKDMEHVQNHVSNIPMMKTEKIKRQIPYVLDYGAPEGPKTVMLDIDTTIEIDNSKEKLAALSSIEKIMDLQAKLKMKIEKETQDGKKTQVKWMFDVREQR